MLFLAISGALAWDECFPFDTPWEALATRRALGHADAPDTDFPSDGVYETLAAFESEGCAVTDGNTTTWDCALDGDGLASGTRTRESVPGTCTTITTTWAGIMVGLEGDPASAALDATATRESCRSSGGGIVYESQEETFVETGTITRADGTTEPWTLTRRRSMSTTSSSSIDDRDVVTVDYTSGDCRLWGDYGPRFDGVGVYDVVALSTPEHDLTWDAGAACSANHAQHDDSYAVGTWDGAPFSDREPTEADPDLDGDLFTAAGGDCADAIPWVHACATECLNGLDDDCDGAVDEDDGRYSTACGDTDQDADGHVLAEDCDDLDATVWADCPPPAEDTADTDAPDSGVAEPVDTASAEEDGAKVYGGPSGGAGGSCGTGARPGVVVVLVAGAALVARRRVASGAASGD